MNIIDQEIEEMMPRIRLNGVMLAAAVVHRYTTEGGNAATAACARCNRVRNKCEVNINRMIACNIHKRVADGGIHGRSIDKKCIDTIPRIRRKQETLIAAMVHLYTTRW